MNPETFIAQCAAHGLVLNDQQIAQFERYFQLLVEWNEKMNLTAITQREEVYLKHFYDCLMALWNMPLDNYALQLCDVGAGAGFPSIPLKIAHPELQVTIVDSLQKRLTFIEHLAEELGLEGVSCVHGRAEDVGQNPVYRGQFDLVTARAVASLNVLAEYCLPLVKIGGQFLALKAQKSDQELEEARAAISILGAKLIKVTEDQLPVESADRRYILIQKTKETPNKFPRKAGKPAKNPIKA
ncbi:16S rRNA (guanine(527)-N(7))-methyltransferase RsmG [Abiotrophia defectiva]|uniref:16S rRNA (guanine(527)-N(7))-methyltransferase RsmG n=1 Tax=Abiotrophia defectiva TaxID=46125 RepID=UPI0028D2D4D4|nr:16S rRNA (guanine(527)-N(7))-methyltransferase RsmG [Abiotrophia defectiva]